MKRLARLLEDFKDIESQLKQAGAQEIKHHTGGKSLSGDFSSYYWRSGDYVFKAQVLDSGSLYSFDMGRGLHTVADYRNGKWIALPARNSMDWSTFEKYRSIFYE